MESWRRLGLRFYSWNIENTITHGDWVVEVVKYLCFVILSQFYTWFTILTVDFCMSMLPCLWFCIVVINFYDSSFFFYSFLLCLGGLGNFFYMWKKGEGALGKSWVEPNKKSKDLNESKCMNVGWLKVGRTNMIAKWASNCVHGSERIVIRQPCEWKERPLLEKLYWDATCQVCSKQE